MSNVERRNYNDMWSAYVLPSDHSGRLKHLWMLICEIAACGHNPIACYVQPSVISIKERKA